MIHNLDSNYDCCNAGQDLHVLKEELNELLIKNEQTKEAEELRNHIENQISFIENKCSYPKEHF